MSEEKKKFAFLYRINPFILIGITAVISIVLWVYGSTILFYIANPGGWQAIAERDIWNDLQDDYSDHKNLKLVSRELVDKEENLYIFYYVLNGDFHKVNMDRHVLAIFERFENIHGVMTYFSETSVPFDGPPTAEDIEEFKKMERIKYY